MSEDKERSHQPHTLLSPADFRTLFHIIDAYILYLKQVGKASEHAQALYTRLDIAMAQFAGTEQTTTISLSHDELMIVLHAVLTIEDALHEQQPREITAYQDTMRRQVEELRTRLLAGLPSVNREERARRN